MRFNFFSGQQNGCGSGDGPAGGYARDTRMRGQLVGKHGCQTTAHGMCTSGELHLSTGVMMFDDV